MRRTTIATLCCSTVLAIGGCTGGGEATATTEQPAAPAAAAAAAGDAREPAGEERLFERDQLRGDGCVVLDAAAVAEAAGVAASQVTENPKVDCLFTWQDGSAFIGAVRAHRSVDRARQHFASFSEDVTAEEMEADKAELQRRLDAAAAEGEIEERDAAVGGALVAAAPVQDLSHRRLDIGDEATVDSRGKVMVRVGNVTFDVALQRGDDIDPELSQQLARRVVANLAGL